MRLLLIDIGNTRCKWGCVEGGRWLTQGVVENLALSELRGVFAKLPQPGRILVSNVAGVAMAQTLVKLLASWQIEPEFVVAMANCAGVINGYDNPAQLGSDRWAALIAARHQTGGACLVVNCGTATTIDALSSQGEFFGGVILPGINMMQHSLAQGAAQLSIGSGVVHRFPRNTADAVLSGAIQATVAMIEKQYGLLEKDATCLLTGGAAMLVQPYLDCPCHLVDNLVLIGLRILGEIQVC